MSSKLNTAQLEAVNYMQGPCLVLAGAGSGKTRVITHKMGRLIQTGLAPKKIAAITFTNKAAFEMRERAKELIGRAAKDIVICTFHALGVRLLREDGGVLGLKSQFSILDSDDVANILKECANSTDLATARQWQWKISHFKNQGLNAAQVSEQSTNDDERQLAEIMARYEERLSAYQSVDFDDLITLPLKLLRDHSEIRSKWQRVFGHILIDEYQDTNATQYDALKMIVGDQARFTAVGDDDQSIYGWRGATLDNLKRLPVDFPQLKVIKLEQNYRSTSAILSAANNVIQHNPKLFPKTLFSELGEGEAVRVRDFDHEENEAESIVQHIKMLRLTSQWKNWSDFAILYRANHQARVFEKALRRAQIPYKVSGGQSFFDRAEIKDLCAWFRLWINDKDDPAFLRAITTPKRGMGHQTLAQLGNFASQYKLSLFESLFSSSLPSFLSQRAMDGLHEFGRYINDLTYRAKQTQGAEQARSFLSDWLKEINYEQYLLDSEDSEKAAANRWSNVLDFCDWMALRCGGETEEAGITTQTEIKNLLEVAQTIALLSTIQDREADQNLVTLSTLHAAKGLEWTHLMLIGVNEGLLPFKIDEDFDDLKDSKTSEDSSDDSSTNEFSNRLQEERRLMYVGITRAQRSLLVSWIRKRKKGREMIKAYPSRFIEEMALNQEQTKKDPRSDFLKLKEEMLAQLAAEQNTQKRDVI